MTASPGLRSPARASRSGPGADPGARRHGRPQERHLAAPPPEAEQRRPPLSSSVEFVFKQFLLSDKTTEVEKKFSAFNDNRQRRVAIPGARRFGHRSDTDVDVPPPGRSARGPRRLPRPALPGRPLHPHRAGRPHRNALVLPPRGVCGEGEGILSSPGISSAPSWSASRASSCAAVTRAWRASSGPSPIPPSSCPWKEPGSGRHRPPLPGGGDLAEVARTHAGATGASAPTGPPRRPAPAPIQRALSTCPHPLVHGDVKLQNVLLPGPDAPLSALTLIDLDLPTSCPSPCPASARAAPGTPGSGWPRTYATSATSWPSSPPGARGSPRPPPGHRQPRLDTLVARCLRSFPEVSEGYMCLTDEGLRASTSSGPWTSRTPPTRAPARSLIRLTRLWDRRGSPEAALVAWPPSRGIAGRRRDPPPPPRAPPGRRRWSSPPPAPAPAPRAPRPNPSPGPASPRPRTPATVTPATTTAASSSPAAT